MVQTLNWQVVRREGENVIVRENQGWRGPVPSSLCSCLSLAMFTHQAFVAVDAVLDECTHLFVQKAAWETQKNNDYGE